MHARNTNFPSGYWPCACTRRDRAGNVTHIKMNDRLVRWCPDCHCSQIISDSAFSDLKRKALKVAR